MLIDERREPSANDRISRPDIAGQSTHGRDDEKPPRHAMMPVAGNGGEGHTVQSQALQSDGRDAPDGLVFRQWQKTPAPLKQTLCTLWPAPEAMKEFGGAAALWAALRGSGPAAK